MEYYFKNVDDITYMSELTPTPIALLIGYYPIGVGVKFADVRLRRTMIYVVFTT